MVGQPLLHPSGSVGGIQAIQEGAAEFPPFIPPASATVKDVIIFFFKNSFVVRFFLFIYY